MISKIHQSIGRPRLKQARSRLQASLSAGMLAALLSFSGAVAGQSVPSNSPFVTLAEGTYQRNVAGPDLGLTSVHLDDKSFSTVPIYNLASGVPGPTDKAIGNFYVQIGNQPSGINQCAYDLPNGAMAAVFLSNDKVMTDEGEGSWTMRGTWELDIVEAAGIYRPFVGGHIHMVSVLHFDGATSAFHEHCFCHFSAAAAPVLGEGPVLSSLGQNGQLACANLQPGSTAHVEWASSALGPWATNWAGLESVTADTNGMIQVSVPMFYRVRGTPPPPLGQVTFTKWVTVFTNQPGLIANMAGVAGGDIGSGAFAGEVFKMSADAAGVTEVVAFYHFTGPAHSFSALVHVLQSGATNGSKGVISGVVTDGWLKGRAVAGEYTQIAIDHDGGTGYQCSLNILSSDPPPTPAKATFTKWISAFPNQPGLIANMAGVVGGDAGVGVFAGEVLKMATIAGVTEIVAFYHFIGPKHSFTALNHVVETTGAGGLVTAVIDGVITDGWQKGYPVAGQFTVIQCDHFGALPAPQKSNCFEGALEIK